MLLSLCNDDNKWYVYTHMIFVDMARGQNMADVSEKCPKTSSRGTNLFNVECTATVYNSCRIYIYYHHYYYDKNNIVYIY